MSYHIGWCGQCCLPDPVGLSSLRCRSLDFPSGFWVADLGAVVVHHISANGGRIHRSNLVGMGVIPFEFTNGDTRKSLGLLGSETVSIGELEGDITPQSMVPCKITFSNGDVKEITLKSRIDTAVEIEYLEHGGVLHYVLRNLAKAS